MEDLARVSRDTDELVEVMSRDLSSSYNYLRIAEVLRDAGREDAALEWAERGLRDFPVRAGSGLRELVAGTYHEQGRHDEAMALSWLDYDERPCLERYRALKEHAERAKTWPAWRDKALGRLRAELAPRRGKGLSASSGAGLSDRSELVRVLLWEGDVEAAWQEARAGGCSEPLWRELAGRRETAHPEDALAIYQRHVELAAAQKNDSAYKDAVELLQRVQKIMGALGRADEFSQYLAPVRAAHRPKRNLMKRIDAATW